MWLAAVVGVVRGTKALPLLARRRIRISERVRRTWSRGTLTPASYSTLRSLPDVIIYSMPGQGRRSSYSSIPTAWLSCFPFECCDEGPGVEGRAETSSSMAGTLLMLQVSNRLVFRQGQTETLLNYFVSLACHSLTLSGIARFSQRGDASVG